MSRMLGIACGSAGGNSEILLKEALAGAEEAGVEVELLRLADLNTPPRSWSGPGPGALAGANEGGVDDGPWLVDRVMECDALIYSAPVYTRTPPGMLKLMGDRAFGPGVDVAAAIRMRDGQQRGDPKYAGRTFDPRALKCRVGGFISVGGASSPDWVTFGLPLLHMMTFPLQMPIVDQIQFLGAALPGTIILQPEALARAKQLGRNVASQIGKSFAEADYLGDAPGTCPVCHLDMIVMRGTVPECAVCGISGRFEGYGEGTRIVFDPEMLPRSILDLEGKNIHQQEIEAITAAHLPRMEAVKAARATYETYDRRIMPPSRRGA